MGAGGERTKPGSGSPRGIPGRLTVAISLSHNRVLRRIAVSLSDSGGLWDIGFRRFVTHLAVRDDDDSESHTRLPPVRLGRLRC